MNIKNIIDSYPFKFLLGGIIVSSVSYLSNNLTNTVISGVIASVPIALPTAVFVKKSKLKGYSTNLLIMTGVLFISTLVFWYLYNYLNLDKHISVLYSMLFWTFCGLLLIIM